MVEQFLKNYIDPRVAHAGKTMLKQELSPHQKRQARYTGELFEQSLQEW